MRSSLRALLSLLVALPACAPGDDGAAADTAAAQEAPARGGGAGVLGTIHATLDGTPRIWYVVEGTARGKPYASAVWFEGADARIVGLSGLDTERPPIETFEFDLAAGEQSFGDYAGTAVILVVSAAEGERSARVSVPVDGTRAFSVGYMPVARTDDMLAGTYMITAGSIEVTEISFANGAASVRGTFRGTLASMDGSTSVQVEDGRFEVSGIPHRDRLLGK